LYGKNLFAEVERYAQKAALIAADVEHDIIHAHDWMTYKAALDAQKVSGKPLVVHIHATELDRTGGNSVHQFVYDTEREGMHAAQRVITVSNFTKNKIIDHYDVDPNKITVIHNAVDHSKHEWGQQSKSLPDEEKVVLFLGRITLQKGPDYFIQAARKVLDYMDNVTFVMAGVGDMLPSLIEKSAQFGMSDKMLFTGFLRGPDTDRAYQMADLYVMPSVSEPFGITPLEALKNNVPVLISKQSGVSEVLSHCLKTDFWDVNEMASKIISVLEYDTLKMALRENGSLEVKKFNWDVPAGRCMEVYNSALSLKVEC
jgi:glycogen synthase